MLVKALEVGEEICIRRQAVDDAHRVVHVVGGAQAVAGVFDGAHVARGNVAGGAYQCKVFHGVRVGKR